MTVTVTNSEDGPFTPNGSTKVFAFTFKAISAADVQVVRRASNGTQAVLSGYTVTLGNVGGSVTFSTAPDAGDPIYILSEPSFEQQVKFSSQGPWAPASVNSALDRAAVRDIYLKNKVAAIPAQQETNIQFIYDAQAEIADDVDQISQFVGDASQYITAASELIDAVSQAPTTGLSMSGNTRGTMATFATDRPVVLFEPGREGVFVFDSSDLSAMVTIDTAQGVFVPPSSDTTGASGAWVRKFDGPLMGTWFGVTANDTTDDSAAIIATLAMDKALRFYGGYGYSTGGGPGVSLPLGVCNCGSTTIPWDHATELFGGFKTGFSGGGTVLKWTSNVDGLYPKPAAGIGSAGADGSIIRNLYLQGAYTDTESEAHGIHLGSKVAIRDCFIINFAGDGIYGNTTAESSNLNDMTISETVVWGCRNGIYLKGSDSNAIVITHPMLYNNRRCNLWLDTVIGVTVYAPDVTGAGQDGKAMCTYSGRRYYVLPNQETGASTNAPSGTTANNTWWAYLYDGSTAWNQAPPWVSGMTWRQASSIRVEGESNFSSIYGGYAEGDQPPIMMVGSTVPAIVMAPLLGIVVTQLGNTAGNFIQSSLSGLTAPGNFTVNTNLLVNGSSIFIGAVNANNGMIVGAGKNISAASGDLELIAGGNAVFLNARGLRGLNTASTTSLNPGFNIFDDGSTQYGMSLGYSNGGFSTRIFAPAKVTFAKRPAGSTLQSQVTEWASISDSGFTCTVPVTGSNLSGTNTGDESSATILSKLSGASGGGTTNFLRADGTWAAPAGGGGGGSGTVTTVSITSANGISGTVANASSTPAITLTLGAITPASVAASGTVTGSNLSGTNTGDETATTIKSKLGITTLSGSNTGDETSTTVVAKLAGQNTAPGNVTASGTLSGTSLTVTGNVAAANKVDGWPYNVTGATVANERYILGIAQYALTVSGTNTAAKALVAATASTVFTIYKGTVASPTTIGTITFAASGTAGTISISAGSVSAGDVLWIAAPATPDATLADIAFVVRA